MGCQPSQSERIGPEIKINIVDSNFMKPEKAQIRNQMSKQNITYQCFISLECFFQQFTKRYYNRVVTSFDNYLELKNKLQKIGLTPNIYVVLDGNKFQQSTSFNTKTVQNYYQLIKQLKEHAHSSTVQNTPQEIVQTKNKINVKILCKPGVRNSEETIFETALKKFNITYQFFNSFQLLQSSMTESQTDFIVTDYIFHKQVVELFNNTKTKVVCYCTFESSQSYSPQIYSLSNNYLDIANDIKNSLQMGNKGSVKCTKVYLYTNGLQEHQEMKKVLELFDIEVRCFSNLEKIIKQTTYFFCVTVISAESQAKNIAKFLQRNDYLERVKIINIKNGMQANVKGMFKIIRSIKKGYYAQKGITNFIDIIDRHYNNTKFQQIKRELENNQIKCFGYGNLSEYIKNKKFISPFIICNYEERSLLIKYMKQLQCKSKIIIFCNKNKISPQLRDNVNFSYVSSHFGKIIKFIRKTLVFLPVLDRQQEILFKEKIDKIKNKNKRISAIKWSQMDEENNMLADQQKFQFLNIAKDTSQASIKDIQKSVATIWKVDTSIADLQTFKKQFVKSLNQLRKIHKINLSQIQYSQLIQRIKLDSISLLLQKVKSFFDADNELGLQINKSLIKTQSLQKKQIINMRQFLLLVFINYLSMYQLPRIGRKILIHWISNPLVQKCQIGSYLFSKNFLVFYQNSNSTLKSLGKYKLQLQLQYNSLAQSQLYINSFITYKDKFIFSPFSKFQIISIENASQFKIVKIRHVKNIDFLKFIYQDNLIKTSQTIYQFVESLKNKQSSLIDQAIKQKFLGNVLRVQAIQHFQKGQVQQAITIHKNLIKQSQERQNLDSFLINQLNFQLVCFYLKKNMNRQAGLIIKDLLQADPGDFIKLSCEKMIKQVIQVNDKQMENKDRRISQQALKTFVWLKNKQDLSQEELKSESDQQFGQGEMVIFDNQLKCFQFDEIDQRQDYANADLGKQNIE